MLVLSRRLFESLAIGTGPDRITVTVVLIDKGKIRLGITAPTDIRIMRSELVDDEDEVDTGHDLGGEGKRQPHGRTGVIIDVKVPAKLDVAAIKISAAVRYDEEVIPNDFPFRTGDLWNITVDGDTGKIRDWPKGFSAHVHMKVCDEGNYWLLDKDGKELAHRDGYVPSCIPGSYGDYIEFEIDGDGTVAKWKNKWNTATIREDFFSED